MSMKLDLIITFALLSLSYVFLVIRLILGPSLPDRVVAVDAIAITTVALILVFALSVNEIVYIDVAIALSLVAFLGTISCARYILHDVEETKERHDGDY